MTVYKYSTNQNCDAVVTYAKKPISMIEWLNDGEPSDRRDRSTQRIAKLGDVLDVQVRLDVHARLDACQHWHASLREISD